MTDRRAWGIGLATLTDEDQTLDVWFPTPALGAPPKDSSGPYGVPADLAALAATDRSRRTRQVVRHVSIDLDEPPADAADAYLRLHLLSHRLVQPGSVALEGIEDVLPVVVWTSAGPCAVESFEQVRLALRLAAKGAPVRVYGVDILPRMSDYVVPPGVRIADADRIRLGAYLAEGTTVSHEGLVTYNAGTLGAAVVQGRLSEGVVVQAGTTVGGGASIMGTDPGSAHISVGRDCLLGANAGVGISLGDACTVEAGLYVTAGTKVNLVGEGEELVVPARELAGRSGLLFRRNSVSGAVEAIAATGAEAQSDADAQSGTGSRGRAGDRGTSAGGRGATESGAGAGDQPRER